VPVSRSRRKRKGPTRAQWMVFAECDCWRCQPAWLKKRIKLERVRVRGGDDG
jgi:hypothetical protein